MDLYEKHSPMFNVKAVTTPTMIQQGEADIRVPISQGYEFYNALKVKGGADANARVAAPAAWSKRAEDAVANDEGEPRMV
jgi:fermentation-respiration switch protein FrsA (DUF1100 family)